MYTECEFQLNSSCKVVRKSLTFTFCWGSRTLCTKNRKKRVWETLWSEWMPRFLLTSAGFQALSCQQKSPSVDKQNRGGNVPFCSVSVFSHLPVAGRSYDKKRWFLSGISRNNSRISKWFVKTYVQTVLVFQGVLGTESSVETWLAVAQRIWYWAVRTPLFTFSAVGRFYFSYFSFLFVWGHKVHILTLY